MSLLDYWMQLPLPLNDFLGQGVASAIIQPFRSDIFPFLLKKKKKSYLGELLAKRKNKEQLGSCWGTHKSVLRAP